MTKTYLVEHYAPEIPANIKIEYPTLEEAEEAKNYLTEEGYKNITITEIRN